MITATLAAALAAASLQATPPSSGPAARECLYTAHTDVEYTAVDDHTIVVTASGRAWRLTTAPASQLLDPASIIVNVVSGPYTLCRPIDFQLSVVTQPIAFRTPLIVRRFEPIPPEQAKALVKRRR